MSLTLNVTLTNDQVADFVDAYNFALDATETPITADMLYQNEELKKAIAEDIAAFWIVALEEDPDGVVEQYEEFFGDGVYTLPGDPALTRVEEDDVEAL